MEYTVLSREPDIVSWNQSGLIQIKIPLDNPLRWVNSYLLRDGDEVTLIDPGPRTPAAEQEWLAAFRVLGLQPADISLILLTHHHPDHYGLSGWLQQQSGAPVRMSERAELEAQLMWGSGSSMDEDLPSFFESHGMPAVWLEQLPGHLNIFIPQVTPAPKVTHQHDGEQLDMGGRSWQVIQTAGHAPGHLSLYHEGSGDLICGDAVLPQISPNVSLLPGSDAAPLRLYLEGLRRLQTLQVRAAYPGHRHPFTHFRERIQALLEHHEERLNTTAGLLASAGPMTAFEVCTALFGGKLGIHQLRFAMCEALAHLAELAAVSRAELRETEQDKYVFAAPGS
ncbi:MBL fold metallo-hydrolase [Paenibacillus lemnae]|uniref:MBL fold metallo-hydrolase n=1 Tax=Paenibacillus lemnae TaxID=1330551 RepID=A0A848M3B8_PAELE|nr:MBL fold metallo-hydrolase [Paenibacillus lemnae]NMO95265.1 MBL fold metallo-hydrolase [Paenibacillus lemnae]